MILFLQKHTQNNPIYLKTLTQFSEKIYYQITDPIQGEEIFLDKGNIILGDSIYPLDSYQKSYQNVFSGIVYKTKTQSLEGYRDTLGTRPFYYIHNRDFFVYSNSIKAIRNLIPNGSVNENWIIKTLSSIAPDKNETFFKEIKALPPGFKLSLTNGEINIQAHHQLTASNTPNLLPIFNKALNERSFGKLGVELSGGIDSSGIAGALASLNPEKKTVALRHVLPPEAKGKIHPYEDEHYYSNLIANKHSNIKLIDVYSRRGILEELRREMQHIGTPFYSSLSLFFDELYDLAQAEGINTLFSGFGGDEGISNKASAYIKILATNNKWLELARLTNPPLAFRQFVKKVIKYQNKDWRHEILPNRILRQELLERYNMKDKFLSETINTYSSLEDNIIYRLNGKTLLTRLTENSMSVQHRGIRYVYPLLDTNLLSAYLSLPSKDKFNYQLPRPVYRSIIKEYVPKEIYLRNNKTSATVPTVYARFLKDYDLLKDFLHTYRKGKASEWVDVDKMISHLPKIKANALDKDSFQRLDLRIFLIGLQMILYFDEMSLRD